MVHPWDDWEWLRGWSHSHPPVLGLVYRIEDVALRDNAWIDAVAGVMAYRKGQHWIDGQSVVFTDLDDAVTFRMMHNTPVIKEMMVEAA